MLPLNAAQKFYETLLFVLLAAPILVGVVLYGATPHWVYGWLLVASYAGLALLALRPLIMGVRITLPPATLLLTVFWLYALAHLFLSQTPWEAKVDWLKYGTYIGAYIGWWNWSGRGKRWRFLFTLILLFIGILSLYALIQQATGSELVLRHSRPIAYEGRASATYFCPNHFAHILELGLVLSLALVFTRSAGPVLRLVAGYVLLVGAAALFFTLSRSGWLGTLAGFTVTGLILLRRRSVKAFWIGTLSLPLVCLSLFGALWAASPDFRERVEGAMISNPDGAVSARLDAWSDTLQMIEDKPALGHGGGSFRWVYLNYKTSTMQLWLRYAHNEYLHITSDYGLVGLALLLLALGRVSWVLLRKVLTSDRSRDVFLAAAGLGMLVASLVHALFDFNFHLFSNVHVLASLMGVLLCTLKPAPAEPVLPDDSVKPIALISALVLTVLCLVLAFLSLQVVVAIGQLRNAQILEAKFDMEAEPLFHRAHATDRWYWRACEGLGNHYSRRAFWALDPELQKELGQEALKWYDDTLALNPYYMETVINKGKVYDALGDAEKALSLLQEAIERSPNNYEYYKDLGLQLRRMQRPEEALKIFTQAGNLAKNNDELIRLNLQWLRKQVAEKKKNTPSAGN